MMLLPKSPLKVPAVTACPPGTVKSNSPTVMLTGNGPFDGALPKVPSPAAVLTMPPIVVAWAAVAAKAATRMVADRIPLARAGRPRRFDCVHRVIMEAPFELLGDHAMYLGLRLIADAYSAFTSCHIREQ